MTHNARNIELAKKNIHPHYLDTWGYYGKDRHFRKIEHRDETTGNGRENPLPVFDFIFLYENGNGIGNIGRKNGNGHVRKSGTK